MPLNAVVVLVGFVAWVGALAALWRGRRWLPFYALGALGAIVLVLLVATVTGLDAALEAMEARQVLALARPFGLGLVVLGSNGLAIRNHTGWGVFDVGIECSALMEIAAMAGLVVFYPAVFGPVKKMGVLVVGTVMTYLFNLVRILFIVVIVSQMGTDWVFPAHAVFGRILFFITTLALYWWLVTMPTVRFVGKRLRAGGAVLAGPDTAAAFGVGVLPGTLAPDMGGSWGADGVPEPEVETGSGPEVDAGAEPQPLPESGPSAPTAPEGGPQPQAERR